MNDINESFALKDQEIELINEMMMCENIEIVWDINAFYFNTSGITYKLSCFEEIPYGSDYKYDQIFFCRFDKLEEPLTFDKNDPKYWYTIITTNCKLQKIELVNVCQVFPNDELIPETDRWKFKDGLNDLSLGLLIKTEQGWIPAFLLPSRFGFDWQLKYAFYTENEIDRLISRELTHAIRINCT